MSLPQGIEHDRRGEKTGPYQDCPMWDEHKSVVEIIEKIYAQNEEQLAITKQVAEIVTAWNAAKGFVKTVGWLSTFFKWIAMIGAGLTAFLAFCKWVLRII